MEKKFKVTSIVDHNAEGYNSLVLVSIDGDVWQVKRTNDKTLPQYGLGDIVSVPLKVVTAANNQDQFLVPAWEQVFMASPIQHKLADPYTVVKNHWGEDAANKYFTPPDVAVLNKKKRTSMTFVENDFKTTPFMSAADRCKIANQFVAFVDSSYKREFFLVELYLTLIQMFGFEPLVPLKLEDFDVSAPLAAKTLADDVEDVMDRFYEVWFGDAESRLSFCRQITESFPVGELIDIEFAIRAYVIQHVLGKQSKTVKGAEAVKDRRTLNALLKKYGIPSTFKFPHKE